MRGNRRIAKYIGTAVVVAACLLIPASATAFSGTILRGFGTATIDASMGSGEWDSAGHVDFTVNRSTSQGGGTVPATLYVMNNGVNLYVGIKVLNATVDGSTAEILFDNNHDGNASQEGEDDIFVSASGTFYDYFVHQVAPDTWQSVNDVSYGGVVNGTEADGDSTGFSFYEFSHPLDSTDNAHDFSLRFPQRIGFLLRFRSCSPCAETSYFPSRNQFAEIVIVSGSRVPPETQISAGPADGSVIGDPGPSFEFTGSDDLVSPSELEFECQEDAGEWRSCTSPHSLSLYDGHHVFSVRAVDEMGNVDPTPAQRSLSVDTTGPSKPVIRGPRAVRNGVLIVRFSSSDQFTPRNRIRFKCALDSTKLHSCPAVYKKRVRPGRHVLRVRAVDSLGNIGAIATFHILVKRPQR